MNDLPIKYQMTGIYSVDDLRQALQALEATINTKLNVDEIMIKGKLEMIRQRGPAYGSAWRIEQVDIPNGPGRERREIGHQSRQAGKLARHARPKAADDLKELITKIITQTGGLTAKLIQGMVRVPPTTMKWRNALQSAIGMISGDSRTRPGRGRRRDRRFPQSRMSLLSGHRLLDVGPTRRFTTAPSDAEIQPIFDGTSSLWSQSRGWTPFACSST